ncbi:hypothetical protein Desgi_0499 [Desulfoscipio gibsoniae DSM 7213]|uniref:Uncharacterized protein n=1 Tax=Desulfoscipio gibsoniae DSM 7213 TaxID=767817 RepID=R4KEH9_9FIRM|nr:hypothetical protein Desgi_0499 [Desulfoscipio gibsoniae DSM 7213]
MKLRIGISNFAGYFYEKAIVNYKIIAYKNIY